MIHNSKYTELDNINRLYTACRGLYRIKMADGTAVDSAVAKAQAIHKQLKDIYKAVDSGTTTINKPLTDKIKALTQQLENYSGFLEDNGYSALVDTGNRLIDAIKDRFGLTNIGNPAPKPAPSPKPTPEEIAAREAANPFSADTSYGAGLDPSAFGSTDIGSSYGSVDPSLVAGKMNTGYYPTDNTDPYMAVESTGYGSPIAKKLRNRVTTGTINAGSTGVAYANTGKPVPPPEAAVSRGKATKAPTEPVPPEDPKTEATKELRKASPEVKAEAAKAMEAGVSLEQLVQLLKVLNKSDAEGGLNFGSSKIDLHFGGMPMAMGGIPMMMGGMPIMMGGGGGGGGGMDPGAMMMQLIMMGKSPDEASKIVKNYMSTFGSMLGGGSDEEEEEAADSEAPVDEVVPGTLYRIGDTFYGPDGSELDRATAVKAIAAHKARATASSGEAVSSDGSTKKPSTVEPTGSGVIDTTDTADASASADSVLTPPSPSPSIPDPRATKYKITPYEGIGAYNAARRKFIKDLQTQELNRFDKKLSGTALGYGAVGGLAGGSLGYLGGDALSKALGFKNNGWGHNILRYGLGATGLALGGIGAYRYGRNRRREQVEREAAIHGGDVFDTNYKNGRIDYRGTPIEKDKVGLPRTGDDDDGFPGTADAVV